MNIFNLKSYQMDLLSPLEFMFLSAACSQRSKQRLSKELSDCVVYCKSVHFRSFKHSRIHSKFYEVASFTESKARKHLREAGKSKLCERCFHH